MKTELIRLERDRSLKALLESEERFKSLLEATTDYIYTVEVRDGVVRSTRHGPGCQAVTGYTHEEFEEDPYLWYRIVHEEDRLKVVQQAESILRGNGDPSPLEHRIICKDGSLRWVCNTCISHRDVHGQLTSYDGLIKDITPQKLAELACRTTSERLQLIIEGSTDGVWDWDVQTGATYLSPRWKGMLGYEDHELENSVDTWRRLIHPDDLKRCNRKLDECLRDSGASYALEHRLRHKDGTYRWILARGVVRRDDKGQPIRMAGSHVDITQQKEAADRLVEAAKMEFACVLAAGVAHEVRNPLQSLQLGTNYLTQRFKDSDAPLKMVLTDMDSEIRKAEKILRSIDPGNGAIACGDGDLNKLVEEALRLVRKDLVKAQIIVCREMASGLPAVCVDSDRMSEVFINLILNAVHAMPQGGTLTVRSYQAEQGARSGCPGVRELARASDVVVAEVQDTGVGIDDENLKHIFEMFWSSRPLGRGSGLGLPVCKKIMDLHHGVIDVVNGPSSGVVATVALPVARATASWCACERREE
jgi:PAS domain S-box-containing protein